MEISLEQLRAIVLENGVNDALHIIRSATTRRLYHIILFAKILQETKIPFPGFKDYIENEIRCVNDIANAYLYAVSEFESKRSIPLCIRKGIAQSFNKFTIKEFAHYDGEVQLSILVRMMHPEPKDEETSLIFKRILNGTITDWK